ncbi:zinc ribbon domain-containing protein [Pontibacillus sp. ALD_SL1]|uniref:zinc ribbon domain-containing protein n=1 Tax=Pontibacillus sp. ALD_SL1 TaxID=2777185 RepID=UPI001A973D64|nr:zinc ribbon domain-containing protein [Pontibacillus sp. ALD_SL1]QST01387.1 zinc ribbon domain-containing protein [Pontibacillus sp. ALD_SL1]
MAYCPYCGTRINSDEIYCVSCGKSVPEDIHTRSKEYKKSFNTWWILPLSVLLFSITFTGGSYWFIDHRSTKAEEKLEKGEELALEGNYESATKYFNDALRLTYKFPAANQNKQYMDLAIQIDSLIKDAKYYIANEQFQEALKTVEKAEGKLNNMDGELIQKLIEDIVTIRNKAKVAQIKANINQDPSISNLKSVLWQIEAIQNEKAQTMANTIQEQIISHAFSNANEALKQNQFSIARSYVEEGLRYAPESQKLQSFKTTVEKEKAAFETAQQNRIEQAMNAAEEEHKKNKNDAVEIVKIEKNLNKQDNLVVNGKIKSVATVPITSVSLSYNLINKDGIIVDKNEVYIYPDTLYPDEVGQFEFTHYDVQKALQVKINKVKWFLN